MARTAAWLAVILLIGTVVLIAWRPAKLREGFAAALGAGLMIATGWATPMDAWQALQATGGIMLFLVGMMVVATVADEAGVFDWAADLSIRASRGNGRFLYVLLYLLGAAITLFLSLDVTAIIFTPTEPLALATLIGTNLGPNLTVFGSLATMLVLSAARQRGIQITPRQYLRVGLLTTPPMILAATLLLVAAVRIY